MNELIKEMLLALTSEVYLYTATANHGTPYIVYGVDGANALAGENAHTEEADQGYIDLFTKSPSDSLIKDIPSALEAGGVSYYLESVQYEEENGILHYEWIWEV